MASKRKGRKRGQHEPGDRNDQRSGKVGSDIRSAQKFGGKTDFGIPTNQTFPGHGQPQHTTRSGEDGQRVVGVGSNQGGPGHGSGGDIDPDIIGVGQGGSGIAASGDLTPASGPEATTGGSEEFASGPPARSEHPKQDEQENTKPQ